MKSIDDFKDIQNKDLVFLYSKFRNKCFNFLAKRFNHTLEERQDIYHDSLLIVYNNIRNRKIKDWNGSIDGYLLGIVQNKAMEYVRAKEKNQRLHKDQFLIDLVSQNNLPFAKQNESILKKIYSSLKVLKDPCKLLLELFYLEEKSYAEICEIMNYNNPDTAKSKKSKCMKRLRKLLESHIDAGNDLTA